MKRNGHVCYPTLTLNPNSSFANMLARTLFASTLRRTSCNTKPQRGVTMVLEVSSVPSGRAASRFRSALCDASRLKNGWYKAARKKRAFRYATSNPCRVPTARYPLTSSLPAIEMAGRSTLVASYLKNHCLMPMASLPKLVFFYNDVINGSYRCIQQVVSVFSTGRKGECYRS